MVIRSPMALLVCFAACDSGEVAPGPDAGPEDAGFADPDAAPPFEPDPPVPPAPPHLPVLTPCPDGWREVPDVEDPAIVTCDPWPEAGPLDCVAGEAHWVGRPSCERVGSPCPDGDWADDLPDDATVLYVRAGEEPGGDGSAEAPFGAIADALANATPGTVVALARGTFDETVNVPRGVTLWGACVDGTVIAPTEPGEAEASVALLGRQSAARNLSVSGGAPTGILCRGADVEVASVVSFGIAGYALVADGGSLHATDLVLRDNAYRPGPMGHAGGLLVYQEAEVEIDRAVVEHYEGWGVEVWQASLTARDLAVRDGTSVGIGANPQGTITLERASVLRAHEVAMIATGGWAFLDATDLSVRDTVPAQDFRGAGIVVNQGGAVEVSRASVAGSVGAGIVGVDDLTAFAGTDLVVLDTEPWATGASGIGIGFAGAGGAVSAELERVAILRNHESGLFIGSGELVATDVTVRDTHKDSPPAGMAGAQTGDGIQVGARGRAQLLRAESLRSERVGVLVAGLGADLLATDLSIRESGLAAESGEDGEGLALVDGGHAALWRTLVDDSRTAGVDVRNFPSALEGTDLRVSDSRSRPSDGRFGVGLWVIDGAQAQLARLVVERSQQYGVLVAQSGSIAALEELRVEAIAPQECASSTCVGTGAGIGIAATDGALLDVRRFLQRGAVLCGVQVAQSTLDLHVGDVRENPIGANVQDVGYDISRLQDEVRYLQNERNLDSSELPLPDLTDIPVLLQGEEEQR